LFYERSIIVLKEDRPYVIMQISASIDGRMTRAAGLGVVSWLE
jgi:riboflavin biosynthesis pyrimidine reductase